MEGKEIDLSKTVCSVDLAKKLKEAGVKQESLWYWRNAYHGEPANKWRLLEKDDVAFWIGSAYSAFTVEELIDIMPMPLPVSKEISSENLELEVCFGDPRKIAFVSYDNPYEPEDVVNFSLDTISLADGMAKALLWAMKQKKGDE